MLYRITKLLIESYLNLLLFTHYYSYRFRVDEYNIMSIIDMTCEYKLSPLPLRPPQVVVKGDGCREGPRLKSM